MKRFTYSVPAYVVIEVDAEDERGSRAGLVAAKRRLRRTGAPIVPDHARFGDGAVYSRVAGAYLEDAPLGASELVEVEPLEDG